MAEEIYPTSIDLDNIKMALGELTTPNTTVPNSEVAPTSIDLNYIKQALTE